MCPSVHRGGLCPSMHHRLHDWVGSLSRGVSVQRVSVQGVCPGGSLSSGGLCPVGSLSRGVSVQGGLCPRGSLSRGHVLRETPVRYHAGCCMHPTGMHSCSNFKIPTITALGHIVHCVTSGGLGWNTHSVHPLRTHILKILCSFGEILDKIGNKFGGRLSYRGF